ncbi:uncharacterized protein [Labrus bergylta]|uniref:uncharacterized protein n=1 Tax=Labrus bergylta TaxID=56723 RepID=UPI003313D32B
MKHLQLLFLCGYCFSMTGSIRANGYSCVSAYWDTVTCVVNITGDLVGRSNTSYRLDFIGFSDTTPCPLVLMNDSYNCVCKVKRDYFMDIDVYRIDLCNESDCDTLEDYFMPSLNIQLTPPHDIEVDPSPETFNVTWRSGYEDHDKLRDVLEYDVSLQRSQSTDNKILSPGSQKFVLIPRAALEPDATYCFKVRSKPYIKDYEAIWSQWSQSTCIKNKAGEEQDNILVTLMKWLVPVCVAAGILLFAFSSPAARMKIKTLSHTPSPAPFFRPLYQHHEGNLQEWFSPKGKFLLTYKPEEILTSNAVTVVSKPVKKDPEENQDLHNPLVMQLFLTQCQTSYVGLPAIHEASPPATMVCPGETSYTQLPCSVWGVNVNISHADSGCSIEDMTKSADSSLPDSPVDDVPPPCFCTDYCILNKTAGGFAPVLVSKGSRLNASSDSLQDDERSNIT